MALLSGGSASLLSGRVYDMSVPYSPSLTPPESVYATVSSAGVKMQGRKKE